MAGRQPSVTTAFEAGRVIRPIFTGGAISLDSNARVLATTLGEDVVLTDPKSGRHLAKVEGDGEQVSTLTLTPSGSHLIVCSRSLSMRVYALERSPPPSSSTSTPSIQPTLLRTVKPHATPVSVLAVDRTSTLLATGGTDGALKVWDVARGHLTHTFRGPGVLVSALHFFEVATGGGSSREEAGKGSKKGAATNGVGVGAGIGDAQEAAGLRLASGTQDGKVRVWDLRRRACVASLDSAHASEVRAIADSGSRSSSSAAATATTLLTAGRDRTMAWWDTRSWKVRRVVPAFESVEAAGFLGADGRWTWAAGETGRLKVWDTDEGREMTTTAGEGDGEDGKEERANTDQQSIVQAIYCPGVPLIAAVQVDHTIALFRPPVADDDEQVRHTLPTPRPFRTMPGTHDEVIDLAYLLPDQSMLALATNSEVVRLLSVAEEVERSAAASADAWDSTYFGQDVALLRGHADIVIALDVDWSGHWVATGAKDNTAKLWRVDRLNKSYTCHATFTGHAETLGAVTLPKTVPPESSPARTNPLDHPPPFLITGSQDQTVKRWDVPRQAQQSHAPGSLRALYSRRAHDKDINALDVHHAGHVFASASQDKTVKVWSVREGEVQGILRGHRRGVWTVKFSPKHVGAIQSDEGAAAAASSNKGVVLTGSGDKTVKIWSLADYTCLRTFEGHSNSILKVAWLSDGAGSSSPRPADAESTADDTNTNKPRPRPLFASAGGDGLVKVWDASGDGAAECTLDNHADRVWALAVRAADNTLASGSADSTVTFWADRTAARAAEQQRAAVRHVEQEQALANHEGRGNYREAITLALQLNHPGRLLALFAAVAATPPERATDEDRRSWTGRRAVDDVLATLSDDQIFALLQRLRDWNTNARHAPVAQRVLAALLRSYPAERLAGLKVARGGQRSVADVLNALRVYTERHYKRLDELVDESYLIEYTLREMDGFAAAEGAMELD